MQFDGAWSGPENDDMRAPATGAITRSGAGGGGGGGDDGRAGAGNQGGGEACACVDLGAVGEGGNRWIMLTTGVVTGGAAGGAKGGLIGGDSGAVCCGGGIGPG